MRRPRIAATGMPARLAPPPPRARRVVAIEKDRRLAGALAALGGSVEVVVADALEVEWPAFDVMVANLPYRISSPITFRLLDTRFERAVLMFQEEFAERMGGAAGAEGVPP